MNLHEKVPPLCLKYLMGSRWNTQFQGYQVAWTMTEKPVDMSGDEENRIIAMLNKASLINEDNVKGRSLGEATYFASSDISQIENQT